MESGYSLSDLAAATGGSNAFGGNGGIWILILLFFLVGMGGNGFGGRNYMNGDLNTYATAASQQQILFNQSFDNISRQINAVGDGIASLGYNQLAQMNDVKTAVHAEGEATRAMLQQNKIESLQAQINALQLQNATASTVKYPTQSAYYAPNPFCNCGGSGF